MKLTNRQMGLLFEDSIQMNDLYTQYRRLKKEIDPAVISVLEKTFLSMVHKSMHLPLI